MASLRVIAGGMYTTIQDLGRWGWQSRGVPVAGPMDPCSHRLANMMVGNGVSLIIFAVLFALSLAAEVLSNDKPLVVRYQGHWYFPVFQTLAETTFGGDFPTPTDYLDPFIREQLARPGNFALYPPNHYHYITINYFSPSPSPARPDQENWLGTDDRGRDLLARLLYGFRLSALFALIVAGLSTLFGVLYGAVQGYFASWTDIGMERFKEIWGAMPVLYMLIIFSSLFSPSFWLLVVLIAVFGWLGIAAYVRAEFLKLTRRLGVDRLELRTDRPYINTLLAFFEARKKRLRR